MGSSGSFVNTKLRVSFSIPNDAYDLIKKIEKDFDTFHKKVQLRKGIHHIFSTHRNDYLNNMYNLYICYGELFYFFAVNSSQEKSISKKLNEMQNIISKYSIKYKKDIKSITYTSVIDLIGKYRFVFNKLYNDSMKQGIVVMNLSLNVLLNYSIDRSRLTLNKGNIEVGRLKKIVMGPKTSRYGEIKSKSEKIDKALNQVDGLSTALKNTVDSFKIDFIKKHDSATLSSIQSGYSDISISIDMFKSLISRCWVAMQNKIGENIKKSKDIADSNRKAEFERWRGLTFACNALENDMQTLIKKLIEGVSDVNSLRKLLISLQNSSIHLAGLLDEKIKPLEDTVFDYSELESKLLSELDKMCKEIATISKEIVKLEIKHKQAVQKIKYELSWKRKMEKFGSFLTKLNSFLSQTSINITNTMRAVEMASS